MACRHPGDKRALVRLVRSGDAGVEVDPTGKKPGRGAYLCLTNECWESGILRGKLERALKVALTPGSRDGLIRRGRELLKENVGG